MFDRSRLHDIAIAGWGITTVLLLLCWSSVGNQAEQNPKTYAPQAYQKQSAAPLARAVDREQSHHADWNKLECAKPQSHDEADLCQQIRMADAAEYTVWLNKAQIVLGVMGAGLLFWTLVYSRRATEAAVVAAKAADYSARAAVRLELPLLRSWPDRPIGSKEPTVDGEPVAGGTILLNGISAYFCVSWIHVSNEGRTAALLDDLNLGYFVGTDLPEIPPSFKRRLPFAAHERIEPNGAKVERIGAHLSVNLTDDEQAAIRNGASFWLYYLFKYSDFMDDHHEVGFCWRWTQQRNRSFSFQKDETAPPAYTRKT